MKTSSSSKDIGRVVLLTIGIVGALVLITALPGLGYVFKEIHRNKFKNYKVSRLNQAFKRLQKQELISIIEVGQEIKIELLDKGKTKILQYTLEEMRLQKTRWDGWWRVVIFDIPEHKRNARDFLRKQMKNLGFYTLQKSVLITPWECTKEIDFIKHFYEVADYVTLIKAKTFDEEERVKHYFNL